MLDSFLKVNGDVITGVNYNSLFDSFYDQVEGPPDGTGVPNRHILDDAGIPFTAIDTSADVLRWSDFLAPLKPYSDISWSELFWDFDSGTVAAINIYPVDDWSSDPVLKVFHRRGSEILLELNETLTSPGGPGVLPERQLFSSVISLSKDDSLILLNSSKFRAAFTLEINRVF